MKRTSIILSALSLVGLAAAPHALSAMAAERWIGPAVSGSGAAGSRYTTTLTLGDGALNSGASVSLEYRAAGSVVRRLAR